MLSSLAYESVKEVIQHPITILALSLIWFIPLLLYALYGIFGKTRSSSGSAYSKAPYRYPNFWLILSIWLIIQLGLFALFIFLFPELFKVL